MQPINHKTAHFENIKDYIKRVKFDHEAQYFKKNFWESKLDISLSIHPLNHLNIKLNCKLANALFCKYRMAEQ